MQVAADEGSDRDEKPRMNEGYRSLGVLNNRGFRINAKKCLYAGVPNGGVRSRGIGYEKC